jgi:hypothetical protein
VPAQLSVGDALVLRRGHADGDRTPIPPRGTAKRRLLMPANPERCLPKCCFARQAAPAGKCRRALLVSMPCESYRLYVFLCTMGAG